MFSIEKAEGGFLVRGTDAYVGVFTDLDSALAKVKELFS